jgi:hypothetical protein
VLLNFALTLTKAKHKASIPFGECLTLLWERNELKRLKNECEAQEREATVRLQRILKILELLGRVDAPAEVRQAVDELIGVDVARCRRRGPEGTDQAGEGL